MPATLASPAKAADGQGFTLNASDLRFILEHIQIAEAHVTTLTPEDPSGTLLGTGPHQIPDQGPQGAELPRGLRTVDGSCRRRGGQRPPCWWPATRWTRPRPPTPSTS